MPEQERSHPSVVFALKTADILETGDRPNLLSADEERTAGRFLRRADADRYRAARIALRLLLGRKLNRSPEGLDFFREPGTKPVLCDPDGPDFNLSHAGDWIAVGIAASGAVIGVDVEDQRPETFWREIAPSFLSERERSNIPQHNAARYFLKRWTAKEAALKAVGTGFALAPETVDVIDTSDRTARIDLQGKTLFGRWAQPDEGSMLCVMTSVRPALIYRPRSFLHLLKRIGGSR